MSWDTSAALNGPHTLTAVARDAAGNTTTSAPVTVTVASASNSVPSITVGPYPRSVAVSGIGSRAYVVNQGDNTISVIDTATNMVIGTSAPLASQLGNLAVGPNGTRLYVTTGSNTVMVVDSSTLTAVGAPIPVGYFPADVAVSPDGSRVYVANAGDWMDGYVGTVSVIDTATNSVVAEPVVGSGTVFTVPQALVVSPNGSLVYVANAGEGSVSVIDTTTNTVVGEPIAIEWGAPLYDLAISPNGTRLYVALSNLEGTGTVAVLDTATNVVVATIPIDPGNPRSAPYTLAISPDGSRLYVWSYR